jgi:hypothetical protein
MIARDVALYKSPEVQKSRTPSGYAKPLLVFTAPQGECALPETVVSGSGLLWNRHSPDPLQTGSYA